MGRGTKGKGKSLSWSDAEHGHGLNALRSRDMITGREELETEPNRTEPFNSVTGWNRMRNRTEPNRTVPRRVRKTQAEPNRTGKQIFVRTEPNRINLRKVRNRNESKRTGPLPVVAEATAGGWLGSVEEDFVGEALSSVSRKSQLHIYIYIYIYVYTYIHMLYIYIYIYIQRERERYNVDVLYLYIQNTYTSKHVT